MKYQKALGDPATKSGTPVVLKINFQYIQDDRINERNHTKIESIGRVGVTFKAMVDL